MAPKAASSDIAVIGGGLIGLSLGIGLARHGFKTTVIDALEPATVLDERFDGRASAIAHASAKLLQALGIWQHMADVAQPIEQIRVSDGPSRLFVHFDHRDIGDEPLGYMVENRHIRYGLHRAAAACEGLTLRAPMRVEAVDYGPAKADVLLEDGSQVRATLVAAADGRASPRRKEAGIPTLAWRYKQAAIVATVKHARDHEGIAHERFLPAGPFAILPLRDNHASLVWTTEADLAPTIMALDDAAFASEVRRRFGDFLGAVEVLPGRWTYPLGLHIAESYVAHRLALIGDAAHGIHPIAGQGLNMGLRDVAAAIEVLVDAAGLGLDIGDIAVLRRYERWRRTDNLVIGAVTDGLNRLFSNNFPPVRLARDLGLGMVNRLPPVKRFFMQHARGTLGRLPKLLKGEAL